MDLEKLDHDGRASKHAIVALRDIESDVKKILKNLIIESQEEQVDVEKRIRVD